MKKNALFLFFIIVFFGCNEEPIGQQPIDNIPPKSVTNVKSQSIPGGAIITYELPDDEDLLYIKAVYSLKEGVTAETISSLYTSSLKIEGFGDTKEKEIKIIAVDRSGNESQAVNVKILPLEPEVITIGKTLKLSEDFGGVMATWQNPNRAKISVVLLMEDQYGEYIPIETFYSSQKEGKGSVRGMDTIPVNAGAYVQDRWENQSEIKYAIITPLFETKFDPLKFKAVELPGDQGSVFGWVKENMWNGIKAANEGYSSPGGTGIWPHSVTVDLGVTGKISRFVLYQRCEPYIFAEGNPKRFQIWGCQTLDPTGSWDSWDLLMDCTSIKPSGLPLGQNTDEDIYVAKNGEEFINDPANPPVRYIRILVLETWAGGDNFQICEFEIYGDNRF